MTTKKKIASTTELKERTEAALRRSEKLRADAEKLKREQKAPREDFSQAAARIVREATKD